MGSLVFKYEDNIVDALNIRASIFMVEQGYSYDIDEVDFKPETVFITVYDDENPDYPIAVARIFPSCVGINNPSVITLPGTWSIGRIAVREKYRSQGVGSVLLDKAETLAKSKGATAAILNSDVRVLSFYRRFGYRPQGFFNDDEGRLFQWMRKEF